MVSGKDRLIVALDVPTVEEALRAVDALPDVTFFKIGLQLFMTGGLPTLMRALSRKNVFVDLKLPGDIGNTIAAVIDQCVSMNVKLLTLSESMPRAAIAAARAARESRNAAEPRFLTVPLLSSLDAGDLPSSASDNDAQAFIVARARAALDAGCDGVIVSGRAIELCRNAFPSALIVSPGIRPSGSSTDDHKRHTTPTEAIRMGADYLVVGRPILRDSNPHDAARRVIDEIDQALEPMLR